MDPVDVADPPWRHPLLLRDRFLDLGIAPSLRLTFDCDCDRRKTTSCSERFFSPILASLFTSAVLAIPSAWRLDLNNCKNLGVFLLYCLDNLEVSLLVPDVLECVGDHRDPHVDQVAACNLHLFWMIIAILISATLVGQCLNTSKTCLENFFLSL